MNPFSLRLFSSYLLAISFSLISFATFGQSKLPEKYYYSEVMMSTTNTGQTNRVSFGNNPIIPTEKKEEMIGKIKEFQSGVDVLNYMSDEGWEFVAKNSQHETILIGTKYYAYIYMDYTFKKLKSENL